MFDSIEKPVTDGDDHLDQIRAKLLKADFDTIKELELYVKLKRIKSLWKLAFVSFVLDVLIVIGELAKPFIRNR